MSLDRMKKWIDGLPADVAVARKFVAEESANVTARRIMAGALSYLVTRMDLIPDWEPVCGVLDDAMVLRVAAASAQDQDLGKVSPDSERGLARLANEADIVSEFLGADLYTKLRTYVGGLAETAVRGRTPKAIVDSEKARADLGREIETELGRLIPAQIKDAVAVERTIKNWFQTKLGG